MDLWGAAWAKRGGVIALWSVVSAESFRSLPMRSYARKKVSLPKVLASTLNSTCPSLVGSAPNAIENRSNRIPQVELVCKNAQAYGN